MIGDVDEFIAFLNKWGIRHEAPKLDIFDDLMTLTAWDSCGSSLRFKFDLDGNFIKKGAELR